MAEAMNKYFASVGETLDSQNPPKITIIIFLYNNAQDNPFTYFHFILINFYTHICRYKYIYFYIWILFTYYYVVNKFEVSFFV